MKVCNKCKEIKQFDEFYKDNGSKNGRQAECKTCRSQRFCDWSIKNRYGIDRDEYNQILFKQEACCAMCKRHQSEFKKSLAVDHDHETGEVRGLLCPNCNRALGLLYDNAETLDAGAAYLRRSKIKVVKLEN